MLDRTSEEVSTATIDIEKMVERAFLLSTYLQLEYGLRSNEIETSSPKLKPNVLPKAFSILALSVLISSCQLDAPINITDTAENQCTIQSDVRMRDPEDPTEVIGVLKEQTHLVVLGSGEEYVDKTVVSETGISAKKWTLVETAFDGTQTDTKGVKIEIPKGEKGLIASKFIGECEINAKEDTKENGKKDDVTERLSKMTLEEKVGQMFMIHISGKQLTDENRQLLEDLKPGGVILMGDNVSDDLAELIKDIQSTNADTKLFISIDQEGGEVKRIKEDPHPSAAELGKVADGEVCESFQRTSEILFNYGINLNFGIVADIAKDQSDFIFDRSFGTNPKLVADKVHTALSCSEDVLNTVKHFPGHGGTSTDSHLETPVIKESLEEWEQKGAIPFEQAIKDDVDMVMMGHIEYPEITEGPASLSKDQVDRLRDMGFEGIVITDDMGMLDAAGFDSKESLIDAVKAGNDILLYVNSEVPITELQEYLIKKFETGDLDKSQLDDSVRRILEKKKEIK